MVKMKMTQEIDLKKRKMKKKKKHQQSFFLTGG